jgi:hypothetical protein
MDSQRYLLESAVFDEKISLAELEEAKSLQRVRELKYEKARFQLDWRIQESKEIPVVKKV